MVCNGLNLIFSRKYSVFVDALERAVLLSKIDVKEDIILQHDMRKKTKTNSYIRGMLQILLIQSKICHIFRNHLNIISKLMTEFVTELVETAHFFSIITISVFKPCGAKVFSLQIHLSSWWLREAAVLILLCNMVRGHAFKTSLSWGEGGYWF